MKKYISLILVISLTVSLAAVLGACGKKETKEDPTTDTSTEMESDPHRDFLEELRQQIRDNETYSHTEQVTDENYENEYNELTLPTAAPTAASTTAAPVATTNSTRETTRQAVMFTSPTTQTTTQKPSGGATASTTAPTTGQQTSMSDTTSMTDPIAETNVAFGGVQDVTREPRPQVTYLDKYVVDIMSGTSYTATTEMRSDGTVIPMTYYVDGSNSAVQIYVSDLIASELNLPSFLKKNSLRLVTKGSGSNAHIYLAWPGSYMELEGDGMDEMKELMGEIQQNQDIRDMLMTDRLEYCGRVSGVGYVCENYMISDDGVGYSFYFTSEGISRWEVIDLETHEVIETMVISLKSGVSNKDAFKVSGKKVSMEDFVAMFEGIV